MKIVFSKPWSRVPLPSPHQNLSQTSPKPSLKNPSIGILYFSIFTICFQWISWFYKNQEIHWEHIGVYLKMWNWILALMLQHLGPHVAHVAPHVAASWPSCCTSWPACCSILALMLLILALILAHFGHKGLGISFFMHQNARKEK